MMRRRCFTNILAWHRLYIFCTARTLVTTYILSKAMACHVYVRRFALALRPDVFILGCREANLTRSSSAPKLHLFSAYRSRSFQTSARRPTANTGQDLYADPFANNDALPGTKSAQQAEVHVEKRPAGHPSESALQRDTTAQGGRRRPYSTGFDRERDPRKQYPSRTPPSSRSPSTPQSRPFRERTSYQSQDSQDFRARASRREDASDLQTRRSESHDREIALRKQRQEEEAEVWRNQRSALKTKFPTGWSPPKRLSPEALEGIRALNAQYPDQFTTPVLAAHFQVSPESIRRILKSTWRPSGEEDEERRQRWERRGESVWKKWVEEGKHAPKKWRMRGIGTGPRREGQDRTVQRRLREGGGGASVPWG